MNGKHHTTNRTRTTGRNTGFAALVAAVLVAGVLAGCTGTSDNKGMKEENGDGDIEDLYPPTTDDWREYMLEGDEIPSELVECPDTEPPYGANPYAFDMEEHDSRIFQHDLGWEVYMTDEGETCTEPPPEDPEAVYWHIRGQVSLHVHLTAEAWEANDKTDQWSTLCDMDAYNFVIFKEPRMIFAGTLSFGSGYDERPEEMREQNNETVELLGNALMEKHPDWENPCADA